MHWLDTTQQLQGDVGAKKLASDVRKEVVTEE